MHSVMERQKKLVLRSGPIYVPSQWVSVIKSAKQKGKPYTVKEMYTEDFFNLKDLSKDIGTNFNTDVNGKKVLWNDIKEIRVDKANPYTLKLRTSFNNTDYQIVKVRRETRNGNFNSMELKKAYDCPSKIISLGFLLQIIFMCISYIIIII